MAQDRHGKIAAVQDARKNLVSQAIAEMGAAVQRNKSADVAIKIWKFTKHRHPVVEVIVIEGPAARPAVRRDDRDAALKRETEQFGIGVRGIDDRHGVFAAGVSEKREAGRGHSLPKRSVTPVGGINVLAVRQTFHQDCTAFETAF